MMTSRAAVSTLILAAGASARMGSCKALLPFGDRTAVEHIVAAHQAAGVSRVVVVIGPSHRSLRTLLDTLDVDVVVHPQPDQGMFSSIQRGLLQVDPTHAVFVHPVDVPLVSASTLVRLASCDVGVAVPHCDGVAGHPPLLPPRFLSSVLGWNGEGGLRAWMADHSEHLVSIEVQDWGVTRDMDEPADYQALVEQYENDPHLAASLECTSS